MNIKFINITYSDKYYTEKDGFIPINAGGHRDGLVCDDSGENISTLNEHFGELTAIYWAWKNLHNIDVIGISHYRRYLMHRNNLIKTFYDISLSDFNKLKYDYRAFANDLQNYDMVFGKKWHFAGMSVRQQFLSHHPYPQVLDCTRNVIMSHYPDAVALWDDFMNGTEAYCCCLFVVTWKQFGDLCNWMFPMLFELNQKIDFSVFDSYQKRMIAFLYERLLNVYIMYRKLNVKEYPFYFINPKGGKSILRQEIGARLWNAYQYIKH